MIMLVALATLIAFGGMVPASANDGNDKVCLIADSGGFDEAGFNAGALAGAQQAARKLHVELAAVAADTETEITELIAGFVADDCDLIIGIGFRVGGPMEPFVFANPGQMFSVVDFDFASDYDNAASVQFRVDQPSFLAGYLAAGISETGKVGVYGGLDIPPVTVFMDGYALGVEYYNALYGTDVEVLGWDPDTRIGVFTFAFEDPEAGYAVTASLFDQGADTVFAVAGPTGEGSLDAAADRKLDGDTVRVIEPDVDWYDAYGDPARVLLTSVLKKTDVAVYHQIEALVDGTWTGGPVWEDLATDGVGLAKYHKTNNQVPDPIRDDLKAIQSGIVDGTIRTVPACTDTFGCAEYGAHDPIVIGAALALTGLPDLGFGELRGTQLAVSQRGELFGRSLAVLAEDAGCSPDGGATAASALVSNPAVAAVVGTSCSGSALAAAPIITAAGYSMVSPSNTAPVLTDPSTHEAGYLRVVYNDRIQLEAMAGFARTELTAATSAIIRQDDPYTTSLAETFVAAFTDLGGTNLSVVVLDESSPDIVGAVANVIAAGPPDLIYLLAFEPLGSQVVIEVRDQPALDDTLIASSSEVIFASSDTEGVYATAVAPPSGQAYDAFVAAYQAEFGRSPATFDAYAFDAANMILDAIADVGTEHAATLLVGRQQLRDALFATGLEGVTGIITCDSHGDCAAPHAVQLWQVQGGEFGRVVP